VLLTPPVSDDILEGVTRRAVLELAEALGIPVETRSIDRSEIYVADEMFLCGTGAQVTPVRSVDRRTIADGQIGATTKKISAHFQDVVHGRVAHRRNWLTPVWG
jgi:branched-chain amino acid aminotransferase